MIFSKVINRYYKRFAFFFIVGILALVAVDWLQLYIPENLGNIVRVLVENYDKDSVWPQIVEISIRVLIIAGGCFLGRIIWRVTLFYASTKIEADLRSRMFEKAERLSLDFYQANKIGTVLAWFTNDTETVEEFIGWGTLMLVDGIFLTILVLFKMILLDWFVTVLIAIPVVLIVIWGLLVEKYMSMKWDNRQNAFDKLYDFSQESFAGIRVIKAFVKETQQLHQFAKIARHNKDVEVDFARVSILFDVAIETIIAVVFSTLIGLGGYFVYLCISGETLIILGHEVNMDAAELIEFVAYFSTLIWPLIALGQVITMRSKAKASLERIGRYLNTEETIKNVPNAKVLENVKGGIVFNHFTFKYPGTTYDSLEDISLEIKPGETIGIVGRIGSGKSTLVNSLARLYNVDNKAIFIDGIDIMKADVTSLRKQLAYVPQDNFLFSETIRDNIAFSGVDSNDETIKDAAKFACVDDDIEHFPRKYDTILGERGVTLSGGQKQRVSIARAFLKDAPILIFDDSVSAVDVKTEETSLYNIKRVRRGRTTLVVASRVSTVQGLDKVIVLNEGRLEAFDSPNKLYLTSPTFKKMVDLQRLEKEEGSL